VEDGDAGDDDVKGEEALMLRRRKRMILRRKTGTPTLSELGRSKCKLTCQNKHLKSHLIRKYSGKIAEKCPGPDGAQNADTHFARACAVETCQ